MTRRGFLLGSTAICICQYLMATRKVAAEQNDGEVASAEPEFSKYKSVETSFDRSSSEQHPLRWVLSPERREPSLGLSKMGYTESQAVATSKSDRPFSHISGYGRYFSEVWNRNFVGDGKTCLDVPFRASSGELGSDAASGMLFFTKRYFGLDGKQGEAVNLGEIGLGELIVNSANIHEPVTNFLNRTLADANNNKETENLLRKDRISYDFEWDSTYLYSLGDGILFAQGICNEDACYFNFSIRDRFEDPSSIGSVLPWEEFTGRTPDLPFSEPFGMNYDFGPPVPFREVILRN